MSCDGIFRRCMELGVRPSAALIFLFLRDEAGCNEDLRVVAGREWLADRLGYSEKVVRNALVALKRAGLIGFESPKGQDKALIITITSFRVEGQPKGQPKGQQEYTKTQYVLDSEGQPKGQPKGHTGVSGCYDVSSPRAVEVSPVSEEVLLPGNAAQKDAPPPPARARKKSEPDPIHFRQLTDLINCTHKATKGQRYVFKVWELQQLRTYARNWTTPYVMALWEVAARDAVCINRGLSVKIFIDCISRLQDDKGVRRRTQQIENELKNCPKSPEELEAMIRAGRQRRDIELEAILPVAKPTVKIAPAKKIELVEPDVTEEDLARWHAENVKASGGRCRTKDCQHCAKGAPVLAGAGLTLDDGL